MPTLPGRVKVIKDDHDIEDKIIQKTKLLLVEGKDETTFFQALFKANTKISGLNSRIQVIEVGGVDKFKNELPALLNRTGFSENVKSIGIVRDSDGDLNSAFQSVCSILSNNDILPPEKHGEFTKNQRINAGVFVMPGNENGTMLEDLCLNTLGDNSIIPCIDDFFNCMDRGFLEKPRNLSKAKVQVYLASMPKIVSSLGLGASKGYWDLNHSCLNELTDFLKDL